VVAGFRAAVIPASLVGADPRVCPCSGGHMGPPLPE